MIIITTYYNKGQRFPNREKYLLETIKSIEEQSTKNILHIIVDDGSDRDLTKIIDKNLLNPQRRVIIRRKKKKNELLTSTNARNFGINFVLDNIHRDNIKNHKYITFVDSDDLLIDVKESHKLMEAEKPSVMYTNALIFFDSSNEAFLWEGLLPNSKPESFWIKGKLPYLTMSWDIDFIKELKEFRQKEYGFEGIFDPNIGCGEDVDIALSSIKYANINNKKVSFLPEITVAYRIHNQSLASTRSEKKRANEENSVLIRHFGEKRLVSLHLKRFISRPECYISSLYSIKNMLRKKYNKSDFISE